MRNVRTWLLPAVVLACALLAVSAVSGCERMQTSSAASGDWVAAFSDDFATDHSAREATSPSASSDPSWWLVSGAWIHVRDGVGGTVLGDEPDGYLRERYEQRNPRDTDDGLHPQNLFRLVTQEECKGATLQECYFRIVDYHLSSSPERYAPNGLLLFTRYGGEDDLYYAGVRVDGHAIVKKKSAGTYYTLAEKAVFEGAYDRTENPTLLPRGEWMGLRTITEDAPDGSVVVSLYMQRGRDGEWEPLLRGVDAGVGGAPFRAGRGGIRTDFMDVQFDDYRLATRRWPSAIGASYRP